MQIMSIECKAQEAKDNLARNIQKAKDNLARNIQKAKDNLARNIQKACVDTTLKEVQEAIKVFLSAHKKSNSIARVKMLTEYVANKRFSHSNPSKMLQTAFNRTRTAWVRQKRAKK